MNEPRLDAQSASQSSAVGVTRSGPKAAHAGRTGAVWILTEVFYPEETSTGHYLTAIASELAKHWNVSVLCARPTYSRKGQTVAKVENYQGMRIVRVSGTALNRHRLVFRLINIITLTITFAFRLLRDVRGADFVIVGTNPPTLPYLVFFALLGTRTRLILKAEDLYPDALVAAGMLNPRNPFTRILRWMQRRLFAKMDGVCALGRDMASLLVERVDSRRVPVSYIPNWADIGDIRPESKNENVLLRRLNLHDKFIVGFAGNFGPLQNIEHLVRCMELLGRNQEVHFLWIGSGKFTPWLTSLQESGRLTNLTLVGQRPRSEQGEFLNACDIGLVSLKKGMSGVGVPSRTYNVMAAGKPILASVDVDSEVAHVVREEGIGWVVAPDDARSFVSVIQTALCDRQLLVQLGQKARQAAESKYSRQRILAKYVEFIKCIESS